MIWMTVRDAAHRVKRSRRQVETWIAEGLPVAWLDGKRYVEEEALLAKLREKLTANPARRHADDL